MKIMLYMSQLLAVALIPLADGLAPSSLFADPDPAALMYWITSTREGWYHAHNDSRSLPPESE